MTLLPCNSVAWLLAEGVFAIVGGFAWCVFFSGFYLLFDARVAQGRHVVNERM